MTRNYSLDGTHDLDLIRDNSILLKFGMPLVFPSNGTIGNNGALSALTALNTTYAECYMYFPAAAIAAGSAAGWYYTVMSSTTAGTIYNNLYTTGVPSTPSTLTAFVTTGPGAYTQTLTPVVGVTIPITGLMEKDSYFDIWVDQWTNSTAGAKIINVNFDTTVMHAMSVTTPIGSPHRVIIQNRGSKARQKVTRPNQTSEQNMTTFSSTFMTVDTAAVSNLVIEFDLAVATDHVSLEGLIVRFYV